ncbi:MAG: hypothetical protein FRX48_06626 [Lasallia pustulata]|uniref:Nodulin-like domain-containing protein n=1 Tax=Lasallia pustulata TaxID=136370 RepID=A0A5M8PM82_9LECA|nr:MAG: hypothetical protein FRX48_06626 [Lasallia pustulata]
MPEFTLRARRVVSVVAATMISLACGTNYVYSAWAPQFAEQLKLSSTQSNLIGVFGNLGMYASGIPVGLLVDSKGPRPGVFLGSLALGTGYFALHRAYDGGFGATPLPFLCFFAFLTGLGSAAAFSGSIKTSAMNWPNHRGTATAFPLSAFGLSAFFFSTISHFAFPDNTTDFLLLLAVGTFTMSFLGFFFLRVVHHPSAYSAVPVYEGGGRNDMNPLHRTKSGDSRLSVTRLSQEPDIRGLALLSKLEFWDLFVMLGLMCGVGLMTINNIGNDVQALWTHYDDSSTPGFIQKRQLVHVSILSVCSFVGRLSSGVGSDIIVKALGMSRYWCLCAASSIFCAAQICGLMVENPHLLGFVSGLTGLAYGFLFGFYPALVAQKFGINGLSQNWGCMTLAPVIFGQLFNLLYGLVYDHHSDVLPDGRRECPDGVKCYRSAYWVTFGASLVGLGISLWSIRHEHVVRARSRKSAREGGREA